MNSEQTAEDNLKLLQKGSGKLYMLCLGVGILTGLIVSIYRWGLGYANHIRESIFSHEDMSSPMFLVMVWIGFIIVGLFVDLIAKKYPKTSGSGIPQVKGIILRQLDYVKWFQELIAKFIGGLFGIGCGLSLGREGPSVQLGSYIGYGATKIFKRDSVEKKISCNKWSKCRIGRSFWSTSGRGYVQLGRAT